MSKGLKLAFIIGGSAIAVLLVVLAVFWGGSSGWMGSSWGTTRYGMMGGFGGWWMIIPMIVVWGLIIWGIVALVGRGGCHTHSDKEHGAESALEILRRRYASGEINKDEYEQKKKDLQL